MLFKEWNLASWQKIKTLNIRIGSLGEDSLRHFKRSMKRYNHLFEKIVDINNLQLAADKAMRGKRWRKEVKVFEANRDELLLKLQQDLINGTYITSEYETFVIYEPKERVIYKLPFYPDRIVHHAIMNILEPIWISVLIKQTYSCIKGRGIHKVLLDVKNALQDKQNTKYCLKLDIRKFYPSINHERLKQIIRQKIKDEKLLSLLDNIINSTNGVPIGNYLSQFFANLYLAYFDHKLKEILKIKYYFRYADDIVILSGDKAFLRKCLDWIKNHLQYDLLLSVKDNYQIFEVDTRGIDFIGYKFYHTHIKIRKRIKKHYCKKVSKLNKLKCNTKYYKQQICSYLGWLSHCNSLNLIKKTIKNEEVLKQFSK